MSQKGQLKHQGCFSDCSPETNILGQINSPLYFCTVGSTFSVVSQTTLTLLWGLSSVKGAFRDCEYPESS